VSAAPAAGQAQHVRHRSTPDSCTDFPAAAAQEGRRRSRAPMLGLDGNWLAKVRPPYRWHEPRISHTETGSETGSPASTCTAKISIANNRKYLVFNMVMVSRSQVPRRNISHREAVASPVAGHRSKRRKAHVLRRKGHDNPDFRGPFLTVFRASPFVWLYFLTRSPLYLPQTTVVSAVLKFVFPS